MNIVRSTLSLLLLIANMVVGAGYLVCAFCPYISPVSHPVLALAGLCIPFFILANFFFLVFWLVVQRKFAVVPFLFFLIGWNALSTYTPFNFGSDEAKGKTLKILTYNVQGMLPQDDAAGKKVIPALDYIIHSGADIVCIQEFPEGNKDIIRKLKKVYPYVKTLTNPGIACCSKLPIQSVQSIKMKSAGNGSAVFRLQDGKKELPVIVNHLESNKLSSEDKAIYKGMLKNPKKKEVKSESKYLAHKLVDAVVIRAPQADAVAQKIREINKDNIVVCGDFNDTPISYARRVIAEGLQDAFKEAGCGPGITYNQNFLFFRIDHILVGKAYRVLECKVDRSIDASDHYPMWCLLEKK